MLHRSRILPVLTASLAALACTEAPRGGAVRLSPVEAFTDVGVDAVALVDRDTTTSVSIERRTRLVLHLGRVAALRALKVHGAQAVAIRAANLGALEAVGDGGWQAGALSGVSDTVTIELEPTGPDARVGEIELWGGGKRSERLEPVALASTTPPRDVVRSGTDRLAGATITPTGRDALSGPGGESVPAGPDDAVAILAQPAVATLRPGGGDAGCVRANLDAGVLVRSARRAYLVYDANLHRPFELVRSVNGGAPSGGFALPATRRTATLVDELDPELLSGKDGVLLCLPQEATGEVTIQGLRLLLVLDAGANGFDRDTERAHRAALDGDPDSSAGFPGARTELALDRALSLEEGEIRIQSEPVRLHALGTFDGRAWSEQGGVVLERGASALPVAGRVAAALALTFAPGARPGVPAASVAELSLIGSGVGPRVGGRRLVVSSPGLELRGGELVGERFGSRAYLAGWAESPAGRGTIEVDGAPVGIDGAFAVPLERAADATGSWTVEIRARFPDGSEAVKVVHLDDDRAAEVEADAAGGATTGEDARFGAENATAWGLLDAEGGSVALGSEVLLEVPEGAVGAATRLGITRKGPEVMPPLDAGMVNVSAPAHSAYRFLPKGQRFAKAVRIHLPYDPELLPEGMAPEEIQTYYYDDAERRWLTLPRVEVRRDRRRIVSETTHFTFMVNAVLVMPEHPGPVSFDPTSIKDLKAADPTSGIDLIEPPTGNSQGTASVSFPFRLPKARGAYQPSLGLVYDSSGGGGWVGVGWDLPTSSVSIDTRYGVPLYDGEERYVLDGAQLVPASEPATCLDASAGRRYRARVERDFRHVVRCGTDTTTYWFEVTDKGGTLFVYGKDPNARLTSYIPRVTTTPSRTATYDVGQWFLERVVDANGNTTRYVYQHDQGDGRSEVHREDFRQVYLAEIVYTERGRRGHASSSEGAPYRVVLAHVDGDRPDVVTSGRVGFKVVTRKLLGGVRVLGEGKVLREYVLDYEDGDFGRKRLSKVKVRDGGGRDFYEHGFEYTSKVARSAAGRVAAFAPKLAKWSEPAGDEAALTASRDKGFGGHSFYGVSVFQPKLSGTVGFALDVNERESSTTASFLDMNGDGLPDRMWQEGGAWLHRRPVGTLGAALAPGPRDDDPPFPAEGFAYALQPDQSLGKETSQAFTGAVQVMGFGAGGNFGGTYSTTNSKQLVVDANGDGLPDLLADGQVWFNQPRCGEPGALCFQRGIPAPVLQDPKIQVSIDPTDPLAAASGEASEARKAALSPEDVVLEWTAPFDGEVDVAGVLRFTREVLRAGRHDGVRLRVFHLYPPWLHFPDVPFPIPVPQPSVWEPVGEEIVKYPDDLAATPVALRVSVERGHVLYFVLSTLSDFPIGTDAQERRYSPEEVGFMPVVSYVTVDGGHFVDETIREDVDSTGLPLYRYDAAADFRLGGEHRTAVGIPRTGRLRIASRIDKRPSSDDVLVCARYFPPGEYDHEAADCDPTLDRRRSPLFLALPSTEDSTRTPVVERDVEAGGILVFRIQSALPIDPGAVEWQIDGEMICVRDASGACVAPKQLDASALRFRATANQPIHVGVAPGADETRTVYTPADLRAPRPFIPPADGVLSFGVSGRIDVKLDLKHPEKLLDYVRHPVAFAVRSPGELYATWKLPQPNPGGDLITELHEGGSIPVKKGVPVFFEAHGEWAFDVEYRVTSLRFKADGEEASEPVTGDSQPVAAFTTCGRNVKYELGHAPLLGGGFHGWRYGLWLGRGDEPFAPWVFRTPSKTEVPRYPDDDEDDEEVLKKFYKTVLPRMMKSQEYRERERGRLAGVLVPSADGTRRGEDDGMLPGVPAWVSLDAKAYVFAEGMSAARRGGSVNPPNGGGTIEANLGLGNVGRTSVATTVTGGVSLAALSLSLSTGMSHQQEDLLDLNGDRIPDVVAAGGVPDISGIDASGLSSFLGGERAAQARVTDPVRLTPRNLVGIPVQPRLNLDLGGQVGLGLTEAVKLLSSKNRVQAVAGRMPELAAGVGVGVNVSTTIEDLVDVNGDGLPDAVRRSAACGGFGVRLNLGNGFARGEDCLGTYGWGADVLPRLADTLDPSGAENPDGDPDTARTIALAGGVLGSSRDASALRQVSTVTIQGSISGSIDGTESYGASVSTESSLSATNVVLADVTGDGLPEYIAKGNGDGDFLVAVNLGDRFARPERWSAPGWDRGQKPTFRNSGVAALAPAGLLAGFWSAAQGGIDPIEATGTHSDLPATSFVFTISWPMAPPSPSPWGQISFGMNATLGRDSGFELGLQDIDGDGFSDHVLRRDGGTEVAARVNQLAGGNLLRRVTRPLHGSFELDYVRAGNTVEMPENRYVLSRVTVHDGVAKGRGHDLETTYAYDGGRHDRNEREFLGFATVSRTNPDATRLVQHFLVDDFRSKGLLEREVVLDAEGRTFVEALNQYEPELVGTPTDECVRRTPMNLKYPNDEYCAATFVKLTATEKRLFEGEAVAGVTSRQVFGYDDAGNVSSFHDEGDVADAADDVFATVVYGPSEAAPIHCTGAPTEITVKNRAGEVLRYRRGVYDEACNLTELHSRIEGTTEAVAKLSWYLEDSPFPWAGNVQSVASPENHLGDAYSVEYRYDGRNGVHVTHTKDVHEYVSQARYDDPLVPDESTWTQDVNGQVTSRAFDSFGRLTKVAAPGFTIEAPTIAITYEHAAKPARALTKNALPQGGTLDTVVVADGLGRVIQTKKTAEIWTGTAETTRVGWSVTGSQLFDAMGRVAEQGQPFFDGTMTPAYAPRPIERPTRFVYDVLGRTIQTVEPNGAITRIAFGFARPSGDPLVRHRTTATDALGKVRVVYRDATEKTVAVEEQVEGRAPTTRYAYDPLGQLERVIDAAGNLTSVKYDLLGRRTELDNPDAGKTVYGYDAAGNLIRREDANLRAEGKEIRYVYDYERLKEIRYPTSRRNVTYTYGPPGAPENGAARITKVEDELGEETRGYDALGNLARSTRTVDPLRPGDRRRTFTTTFQLDVFGRMLSMVYPDGEVLTYGYDRGGLLKNARGDRPATAHAPAEYETYLQALLYDHFGQRVYQRVGNGVVTKYAYEPDTRRLATLYTRKPGERLLQNLFYRYDLVGNVLGVKNALGEAVPSHAGDVEFTYRYDDLHRLTYAHGEAKARPSTLDTFTSRFEYTDIHNMRSNVQEHHVLHGPTGGGEYPPHTNHALEYTYGGKGPHQATRIGDASFVYDANGNTVRECRDPADSTCTQRPAHLRRYEWTEENRLDAVIDGGGKNATKFFYDADGQRVAKLGRGGESITIGQFWALKGRRAATKHVFAGTARIASKLLPPPGWDDVPRGPVDSTGTVVTTAGEVDNGCNPSNYQPQKCGILPGGEPVLNDYYADAKVRPETYYYHPDHLGSTSWVTDQNGRVHERVEYFPYGAVWRDPRSDIGASPVKGQRFLFTGKELDEETGLYYFGARYYDPVRVQWKSVDPIVDALGRIQRNPGSVSELAVYSYVGWRPLVATDPTGKFKLYVHEDIVRRAMGAVGGYGEQTITYVAGVNRAQDFDQRARFHFDANSFGEAIATTNERLSTWRRFGTREVMTSSGGEFGPEYGRPGLDALGGATHTIEDFYAHSNWVELYDRFAASDPNVPTFEEVFDKAGASYGQYGDFRKFLKSNPIRSGTFGLKDVFGNNSDPNSHSQMNLDELRRGDPRSLRLFPKAHGVAVRATEHAIKTGRAFTGAEDAPFQR